MTGPRQNDAYVARRAVASNNLIPVKQICCGYNMATCALQCTGMNMDGFWYLLPLLQLTVHFGSAAVQQCSSAAVQQCS